MIGLGDKNANLFIYIENIPPLIQYQQLTSVKAMQTDEINTIAAQTGNHWRKIFNVFAKLIFTLTPQQYQSWQQLRDAFLLQADCRLALIFSPPNFSSDTLSSVKRTDFNAINLAANDLIANHKPQAIHLIMGKTYATKLGVAEQLRWLNEYFAIDTQRKIIICPYFDYRQLSNLKIVQLANLIQQLN